MRQKSPLGGTIDRSAEIASTRLVLLSKHRTTTTTTAHCPLPTDAAAEITCRLQT